MFYFENKEGIDYRFDYAEMAEWLNSQMESNEKKAMNLLYGMGKEDLFFMMYFFLNILPINDPWLVPKIYEIQDNHNGTLDLWSRETYKSTTLTYGLPIQDCIKNPENRQGIFSNTRTMAKKFLRRIKFTLEGNLLLKKVYSDILYDDPAKQSPKWSEDEGLLVKRLGAYNEMSIEAWGVTDSMPTGAHFTHRIYDDLVTWDTTRTSDQINKTREGFELSHNLGVTVGGEARVIGTRYDYNDLYSEMIKSGEWRVRLHAADKDPKYWDEATIARKKRLMGSYTFATQISLNPISESDQKFNVTWIKWYQQPPDKLNKYLIVDPANEKKSDSSYTVMWVVGAESTNNIFVLDIVRDKLNLTERWKKVSGFKIKHPDLVTVGYEKYSMQADIAFLQLKMAEEKQYFNITPLGGLMSKDDRIRGLIPYFETGRIWLPKEYWYTDVEGRQRDLIKEFLEEEYLFFPAISKKDMLDALARITSPDLGFSYPSITSNVTKMKIHSDFTETKYNRRSWLSRVR